MVTGLAVVTALLLAAEIARLTVATAEADTNPGLALRLAPGAPSSSLSEAMAQVGRAAAGGRSPGAGTRALLNRGAARAPLRPEPFLVQAALAQRAGRLERAAELLEAARWRDPRSAAARYLLSEVLIRQGKVAEGVAELAVLTQIMQESSLQLVPALASYAKQPGARQTLGRILQINPDLKRPLLTALAADPSNADLILTLAGPNPSADRRASAWQSRLIDSLIRQGNPSRAYDVWKHFAGLPDSARTLLFNGDFTDNDAPPPFNWRYASTAAGFAQPVDGTLRVLYYGRDDVVLARQLLLLPQGKYQLRAPVSGSDPTGGLEWSLSCGRVGQPVMQLKAGAGAVLFEIPAGCPLQALILRGVAMDSGSQVDVRIGPVTIRAADR